MVALLPLELAVESEGTKTLRFPNELLMDTDILVRNNHEAAAPFLLKHAVKNLRGARLSMLSMKKDSQLARSIVELVNEDVPLEYELTIRVPTLSVDISDGWEAYLAKKSRNFREQTNQLFRDMGDLKFRFLALEPDSDRLEEGTRLFLEWNVQKMGQVSVYSDQKIWDFTMDIVPSLARKRMFQIDLLLDHSGSTRGVFIEACGSKILLAYQHGFDPELKEVGAGRFMLMAAIKAAADQGFREYDIGRTINALKARIMTGKQNVFILNLLGLKNAS